MKRVVITGMGIVSALGHTVDSFWDRIVAGKHNFTKIENFDNKDFDIKLASEIKGWDPVEMGIPKKEARRMDKFTQYAIVAAAQAMQQAGNLEGVDPYRIGTMVGSGIGGFESIVSEHAKFIEKGGSKVSVFFIPMMISNMAAGMISIKYGLKGDGLSVVTACASSSHAIGEAFRKIKYGYLDMAVAGGAEATVAEFPMAGFNNMGAVSRATDPNRISIPFDKERNGFVLADGAGIVVLEEYEHAKKRGAKILGEIIGYGATSDAYHITSPAPDGLSVAKAMEVAVKEGDILPTQVDYINAHGTSTPLNDLYETIAIKALFKEHAYKLAVSSTKSTTGHMLGAAGAAEAIISVMSLKNGVIPPTAGYKVPDPDLDLDYVTEGARKQDIRYALSNSLGFGGQNACLLFASVER